MRRQRARSHRLIEAIPYHGSVLRVVTKRDAVAALLIHAVLVTWLTWPLAVRLSTHLPNTTLACRFDTLHMAWVLSHESRALVNAPWEVSDAKIYHPASQTLFYGEAGFGAVPYFAPPFLLTGNPALALNLTFLVCLALTAWALHLVVVRWSGSHLGGFLAGWTFLTSHWVHWFCIPTAPNYAVLQYFPLIMLLAASPAGRLARCLRLVPLVILQGLTSVYVAGAVVAPLGLLGLGRLARRATRRAGLNLVITTGLAALLLLAAYSGYLVVRADNPSLGTQTVWHLSAWLPRGQRQTQLPGGLFLPQMPTSVPSVALFLVAAGSASLILGGRRKLDARERQGWLHGAFWLVAGLFISLTPTTSFFGTALPVPQLIVAKLFPIYEILREVHRLAVAALMGLSILAGLALVECTRRLGAFVPGRLARLASPALALTVAALMYSQTAVIRGAPPSRGTGGPIVARSETSWPNLYPLAEAIAPTSPLLPFMKDAGGPLLELPVEGGTTGAPAQHAAAMYRSIFHARRLLNGYNGYWPVGFPERIALARRLPAPGALDALRKETGLAMILVHAGAFGEVGRNACEILERLAIRREPRLESCGRELGMAERVAWLALADEGGRGDLRLIARDGDDLLFAVRGRGGAAP